MIFFNVLAVNQDYSVAERERENTYLRRLNRRIEVRMFVSGRRINDDGGDELYHCNPEIALANPSILSQRLLEHVYVTRDIFR